MTKTIDGKMPSLFTVLPRLPYGIREIPAETAEGTTTAYYKPGSPGSGIAGTYSSTRRSSTSGRCGKSRR